MVNLSKYYKSIPIFIIHYEWSYIELLYYDGWITLQIIKKHHA